MSTTEEKRQHKRSAGKPLEAELVCLADGRIFSGSILNASVGGVFVALEELIPVGTQVRLRFELRLRPGWEPHLVDCQGVVKWSTAERPGPDSTPGIGVEVLGLGPTEAHLLGQILSGE